jgi:MacB-like periplasmic core domain
VEAVECARARFVACKLPSVIVRMANFVADLRYCLRVLSRSPGFALVVVLTLGICIGANTAIFSAVNAILIQPLPAPHSERLVRVYQTNLQSSNRGPTSIPTLLDWQHENEAFSGLAGYAFKALALQDRTGAEGILGTAVSPNYFAVLGLTARLGRTLTRKRINRGAITWQFSATGYAGVFTGMKRVSSEDLFN